MENEKLFIGNLSFQATEEGLRELLSQYGTVKSIRLSRKKGHAVIEMSDKAESDAVISNLDGRRHMERELHISYEISPKKAKTASVKRFNDKRKSLTSVKEGNQPAGPQKSPGRRAGGNSAGKPDDSHKSHRSGAPKQYSRGESADTNGNSRFTGDNSASSENNTAGGYYSRSFKKRAASASRFISKFNTRQKFTDPSDDFMKDEKGRDYRDMEKNGSRDRNSGRRRTNADSSTDDRRGPARKFSDGRPGRVSGNRKEGQPGERTRSREKPGRPGRPDSPRGRNGNGPSGKPRNK